MYMNQNMSFSKQLIIYLVIVLIVVFLFISLILANSVNQFIGNNAYIRSQSIAENVQTILSREIDKIERIPNQITEIYGQLDYHNAAIMPAKILKSYSTISGCSVCCLPNQFHRNSFPPSAAFRCKEGKIITTVPPTYTFYNQNKILKRNQFNGYWTYSKVNGHPSIAYSQPIYDRYKDMAGLVKLDLSLKTISELLDDYKFYRSGYLFITDEKGNYISHPDSNMIKLKNIFRYPVQPDSTFLNISRRLVKGETGSGSFFKHNQKYFIYYTPIPYVNWRLGICCPYNEILTSSNKLYFLIFLCLGAGLLFLFAGIANIVHRFSDPLRQLAYTARQIAHGRFDILIPEQHSSNEINELYASFRYMQQNLINYIERLKISTAAREQMNTEMELARQIQQGLLPRPQELPGNISLVAKLQQSRQVGGDLYEYFMSENYLHFAIGDVSGKSIPAAMYMASFSKLCRYIAHNYNSTATICNIINKQMCDDSEGDTYITIFIGILDINTGILKYTNAGHPYPLIIHENGLSNFLTQNTEIPIGVLKNHYFTEHTYTLRPGTSILLYTDGVTDAENRSKQFYSKERLIHYIQSLPDKTPEHLVPALLEDVKQHIGKCDQSDDLTLMDICYKNIPGSKKKFKDVPPHQ